MSSRVPTFQGGVDSEFNPGQVGSPQSAVRNWHLDALYASEGHRRIKGTWSGGGPFYCVKRKASSDHIERQFTIGGTTNTYVIGGVPQGIIGYPLGDVNLQSRVSGNQLLELQPSLPQDPSYADASAALAPFYATGYARARPGNAPASLGQFLIELRDVPKIPFGSYVFQTKGARKVLVPVGILPKVMKARTAWYKSLADEYLNVQFGWRPFISDLQKMYNLWKTMDKQIAQIRKDNGKRIHRRSTVSDDNTSTQTSQNYNYATGVLGLPPIFGGSTSVSVTVQTTTKIWFSGCFTYYLPEDHQSSQWTRHAKLALFGALPTPELIWEIMPWSWLIDWFSNVGDIMTNLSPNAVGYPNLLYSYLMKHQTVETTATAQVSLPGKATGGQFPNIWGSIDHSFKSTYKVESKLRMGGGNPYGLNVSYSSLSAGQKGILAALGISRSRLS